MKRRHLRSDVVEPPRHYANSDTNHSQPSDTAESMISKRLAYIKDSADEVRESLKAESVKQESDSLGDGDFDAASSKGSTFASVNSKKHGAPTRFRDSPVDPPSSNPNYTPSPIFDMEMGSVLPQVARRSPMVPVQSMQSSEIVDLVSDSVTGSNKAGSRYSDYTGSEYRSEASARTEDITRGQCNPSGSDFLASSSFDINAESVLPSQARFSNITQSQRVRFHRVPSLVWDSAQGMFVPIPQYSDHAGSEYRSDTGDVVQEAPTGQHFLYEDFYAGSGGAGKLPLQYVDMPGIPAPAYNETYGRSSCGVLIESHGVYCGQSNSTGVTVCAACANYVMPRLADMYTQKPNSHPNINPGNTESASIPPMSPGWTPRPSPPPPRSEQHGLSGSPYSTPRSSEKDASLPPGDSNSHWQANNGFGVEVKNDRLPMASRQGNGYGSQNNGGLHQYIADLEGRVQQQDAALKDLMAKQRDNPSAPGYTVSLGANPGAVDGTFKLKYEADFLRRCLAADKLSQEDRHKALGVLKIIDGDRAASDNAKNSSMQESMHNVTAKEAEPQAGKTSFELQMMHDISKSITKTHALMKFQRIQQDSDRLARIEEKLKDKGDSRVTSFQKRTAREVEALRERLEELARSGANFPGPDVQAPSQDRTARGVGSLRKPLGKSSNNSADAQGPDLQAQLYALFADFVDLNANVFNNSSDVQKQLAELRGSLDSLTKSAAEAKSPPGNRSSSSSGWNTDLSNVNGFRMRTVQSVASHGRVAREPYSGEAPPKGDSRGASAPSQMINTLPTSNSRGNWDMQSAHTEGNGWVSPPTRKEGVNLKIPNKGDPDQGRGGSPNPPTHAETLEDLHARIKRGAAKSRGPRSHNLDGITDNDGCSWCGFLSHGTDQCPGLSTPGNDSQVAAQKIHNLGDGSGPKSGGPDPCACDWDSPCSAHRRSPESNDSWDAIRPGHNNRSYWSRGSVRSASVQEPVEADKDW
ncbi:hypothetical protein LTR37_000749 [Vermiconidia calcicola]|uniref:Uncharacterized protein n=1 Tax=Vermiconidia calcicola TaxID=1690605 RepID=A0ACC3NYI0_9PEZI|nr:hypothetical protein LTR37_000749 [Vermiconidia calcicola]